MKLRNELVVMASETHERCLTKADVRPSPFDCVDETIKLIYSYIYTGCVCVPN